MGIRIFSLFALLGLLMAGVTALEAQEPAAPPAPAPAAGGGGSDGGDARRVRVNATAKLELPGGTIQVIYPLLPADGPDAAAIDVVEEGEVLELTRAMAVKLRTELDLRFAGGAVARADNLAPGYPGVYSLWLRRRGDGWSLVLNSEPDIWGTMRDPAADVGETPVEHRLDDSAPAPVLAASLVQTNGGGQLTIAWGSHRWIAGFEIGERAGAAP